VCVVLVVVHWDARALEGGREGAGCIPVVQPVHAAPLALRPQVPSLILCTPRVVPCPFAQITNLRSQVAKMTCVAVAELVVTMQADFECMVDPIVVALLKLPKIAKEVGSAGHPCTARRAAPEPPSHLTRACTGAGTVLE
jgi:hypothetical protein